MSESDGDGKSATIELFADGSFCGELGLGTWAFKVPAMNLEQTGSSAGRSCQRFEFMAVLQGLEEVVAAGDSDLSIEVFSDCDSTVDAINRLGNGEPLHKPKGYEDRADLMPRLLSVLAKRRVHATRYRGGSLHHQACHRNASLRLRGEIDREPGRRLRLALVRLRSRLTQLIREREPLLDRLAKFDEEIAILQTQIEALETSISALDGPAGADQAGTARIEEELVSRWE